MDLIAVQDAAELAGVHVQSIRRWLKEGKLRRYKKPGKNALLLDRGEVERFIQPVEVGAAASSKESQLIMDLPGPGETPKRKRGAAGPAKPKRRK